MGHIPAGGARLGRLLVLAVAVGGCATSIAPVVVGGGPSELRGAEDAPVSVLVLPPHLAYELVSSEAPLDPRAFGADDPSPELTLAAVEGLDAAGFRVLQVDSVGADARGSLENSAARLVEEGPVLVSEFKDKAAVLPVLAEVGRLTGASLVCVHTLTVKVGSGASWNMQSGSLAQGTSSSAVRVALVRTEDGAVLWHNECLVRELPAGRTFEKTIRAMYVTSRGRMR